MAPHHTNDLAPLLRYESSKLEDGQLTSLAEYAACRLPRCTGTALVTARAQVHVPHERRPDRAVRAVLPHARAV
jgi:hypothetical protein